MWIHNRKNWPNFNWNTDKLASKLADIRYRQGLLLGKMKGFGFALKSEANLNTLTNDVIKSSAIEGENLNPVEVRSSIARRLGLDVAGLIPSSRNVDGVVELMLDATQNYAIPLSKERLFGWQSALFPTGRSGLNRMTIGKWRTAESGPMQVVSGPIGRENVHFEAPHADRLAHEMKLFIKWFNSTNDVDPVLRAGIAHLWFITIHPFEDGNGRIARAIADMSLARADGIPERFYSLSTQIESNRKGYYNILERQQSNTSDITNWLEWFIECIGRSITGAEKSLGTVLFKSR
ncbi:MAG: Fic family protein, partial [Candidatus Marinimicrobia bacterium]|nr:Fic family protein [Candidatus Neomarinimicrobiota bacterium]